MSVPTIALDQYCFQVPRQYWLPTPSRFIIRGLASIYVDIAPEPCQCQKSEDGTGVVSRQ